MQAIENSSEMTKVSDISTLGPQADPADTRARNNILEATDTTDTMESSATATTASEPAIGISSQKRNNNKNNDHPKAPLERLSPEVLATILQHLSSPDQLFAAICVSRTIYLTFRSSMVTILACVLENAIDPAVLPLALFICENCGDDDIPIRRDGYLHKRYDDGEKIRESEESDEEVVRYAYFRKMLENVIKSIKPFPDELIRRKLSDLRILVPLYRLYNLVDLFAHGYCAWTSKRVRSWAKRQDEDDTSFEHFHSFDVNKSDLSRYEYARVQRAFLYFEIHRRFFADLEHCAIRNWTAEERQKVRFKTDTVYSYLKETERRELRSVTAYLVQEMEDRYSLIYNFMIYRLLPDVELRTYGNSDYSCHASRFFDSHSEVGDGDESIVSSVKADSENEIAGGDESVVTEDNAGDPKAVVFDPRSIINRDEEDGDNEIVRDGESMDDNYEKADSDNDDDGNIDSDMNSNSGEGETDGHDGESSANRKEVELSSLFFNKSDIDATLESASDFFSVEGSLVKCGDSGNCDHGIGDDDNPSFRREGCASLIHDSGLPYCYRAVDFAFRMSVLKRIKINLLVEAGLPFCRLIFARHRSINILLALILQYCISRKDQDPTYEAMYSADEVMVPDSDEDDAATVSAVLAASEISNGLDPLRPGALISSSSSSSHSRMPQPPSSSWPISEHDAHQGVLDLQPSDIVERVVPHARRFIGYHIWDDGRLDGFRCELAQAFYSFSWERKINVVTIDYEHAWNCLDLGVSPRAFFMMVDALTETTRPYQSRLEEVIRQFDYLPLP